MSQPDEQPILRRQRLLGFARATRDAYMPKLMPSDPLYDQSGNLLFPKDTTIALFPSYTRQTGPNEWIVDVRGWLSCPGLMTRKNRLILSLARQITRYNLSSQSAINQLEDERLLQDIFGDDDGASIRLSESITSSGSRSSSYRPTDPKLSDDRPESRSNFDHRPDSRSLLSSASSIRLDGSRSPSRPTSPAPDMLEQRLACFISRSIPFAKLHVAVGTASAVPVECTVKTDQNGHFEVSVPCTDPPNVILVRAATDETIFAFEDINIASMKGLGVISDIDDTVKLTGVTGDKRALMQSLLLKEVAQWNIPEVVRWYHSMSNVDFHYVSNLPWQLYLTIAQYLKWANLPVTSIHLKQYTGNIISSLMEPSSLRKKRVLYKILSDFPNKQFVCIGDSGEHDFEAYVDLAAKYPGQIKAIYIRYVPDLLSEVDDDKILSEIARLLLLKRKKVVVDLIDIESKLPPLVPKKPDALRAKLVQRKPPLPSRDRKTLTLDNGNDMLTPNKLASLNRLPSPSNGRGVSRLETYGPGAFLEHAQGPGLKRAATDGRVGETYADLRGILASDSFFDMEEMDRKGAQWIRRVVEAMEILRDSDTQIRFFTDDDVEFFREVKVEGER